MSKEIESISTALFDKIRSRFPNITLGDENAKACHNPEKARFFNFTYGDDTGNEFGKVTVSLIDEISLKAYFGQSMTEHMDQAQRREWYNFLRNLRQFARRNLLTFDTRDINKSNLKLQDVKQQSNADGVATAGEVAVTESKLYGTPSRPRESVADHGNVKVRIKHSAPVIDEVRGARSRKIEKIFLETEIGERFLLAHRYLPAAYAQAEHLCQQGVPHDERWNHIEQMVKEMASMSHFVRSTKLREFDDPETAEMTKAAVHHYDQLKRKIRQMRGARGYRSYFETYMPAENPLEEVDLEALKERWVKKVYDSRFDAALPIVYREYRRQQESAPYSTELDEWANSVLEDIAGDDEIKALNQLFAAPIAVGIDGIDALTVIKRIVPEIDGDDELPDIASARARDTGPDSDFRDVLKIWLQSKLPELYNRINIGSHNVDDAHTNFPTPTSPESAHPNDQYGATGMDWPAENPVVKESDDLDFIRSLAGLRK
jgi:hypothetical protein